MHGPGSPAWGSTRHIPTTATATAAARPAAAVAAVAVAPDGAAAAQPPAYALRHRLGVVLAPADLAEPLARAREACALRRSAAVEGERGGCACLLVSATLCVLYVGLHTVQCHGASGVSM